MKILIIRFSSIGDIVLTTPVVRAIKDQIKGAEVHFLTKESFKGILENNPHIDKLYTINKDLKEVLSDLLAEKYDHIVDLHKNLRTLTLKLRLKRRSHTFPKLNPEKWLLVNFKWNRMPKKHVVDRYFEAVSSLGVQNEHLGCEFYLTDQDHVDTRKVFDLDPGQYITVAIGAQFATKRMPIGKLIEIIGQTELPVLLVGGPTDAETAKRISQHFADQKVVISTCGEYSLARSASIVKQSACLLTNDTGMMHIATCFGIPIVSVWGNTVPALGMYPYYPVHQDLFSIHEVKGLSCRPCSKIGFQECPKKHFKCMELQDAGKIAGDLNMRARSIFQK